MSETLLKATNLLVKKRRDNDAGTVSLLGLDTLSEAYNVQGHTVDILGAKVAGWKASLLPDGSMLSAPIFDCDLFLSGDTLPIKQRMKDGVECELAFLIGALLGARPNGGYTAPDVIPCIGGAMAAFEMLNSRLVDSFCSPTSHLLADNLGNGGVVLGPVNAGWQGHNFAEIPVSLTVDGATVLSKNGGHPVGNPFNVVVALTNHLADRGKILEPGQFVITGSYTGVREILPGQRLTGTFAGFESVVLNVANENV